MSAYTGGDVALLSYLATAYTVMNSRRSDNCPEVHPSDLLRPRTGMFHPHPFCPFGGITVFTVIHPLLRPQGLHVFIQYPAHDIEQLTMTHGEGFIFLSDELFHQVH